MKLLDIGQHVEMQAPLYSRHAVVIGHRYDDGGEVWHYLLRLDDGKEVYHPATRRIVAVPAPEVA